MVEQVKPPLTMTSSRVGAPVKVLAAACPANVRGKATDNGPNAWAPANYTGDLGEVSSLWLWPA